MSMGYISPVPDHPDIAHTMRTGYAPSQSEENQDTEETRIEFAEEHSADFLRYVLAHNRSILDQYIQSRDWEYRSWLN